MSGNGKLAVVTGAGRGIGRSIAVRLAKDGFDLAVIGRDASSLTEVIDDVRSTGRNIHGFTADVRSREQIERSFAELQANAGPVDVLVNNAGQSAREQAGPFWESDLDVADWMIDLNLRAAIYCTRQVAPSMHARKSGRIIHIGSNAAFLGTLGNAAYVAAKAGLLGFTKTLARELAPHGVNVNTVAPGLTRTRAIEQLPDYIRERSLAEIPQGHPGEPEDIAAAVSFLSGPESNFITGQCLVVDGGRFMH